MKGALECCSDTAQAKTTLMGVVHACVGGVCMCVGLGMGVRAGGVHGCG
jgi:hypothetical protein